MRELNELKYVPGTPVPQAALHTELLCPANHLGHLRGDQQQDQTVETNGLRIQGRRLLFAEDPSALRTPKPKAVPYLQLKDERLIKTLLKLSFCNR